MPNNGMEKPVYQKLNADISIESLPDSWNFRFDRFSDKKHLYDYQKEALMSALKFLHNYYSNLLRFPESAYESSIQEGKKSLFKSIKAHIRNAESLGISSKNGNVFKIAEQYYEVENERIPFYNFTNRMGFWMATGSGKSLVIVKLIEILHQLKKKGTIPDEDILFLTYREDLITQIKAHIDEFNSFSPLKIRYWELKDYDNVKHNLLFNRDDINIFIYRSDLISDTSGEKLLSFEDIENNGKWYIILDEAHKGNKEDSKRQIFYSILSRNGFLFNFSATFTDPWDLITTVFNLNLEAFTGRGYGKNVYVSQQGMEAFERKGKSSGQEEKKIVALKTLITLAMAKKAHENLSSLSGGIYHNPMLVLYGNTTNIENSDLQVFFETLGELALNKIDSGKFEEAKASVVEEFKIQPGFVFGQRNLVLDKSLFDGLTFDDILKYVYNSRSSGKIEVITTNARKASQEELAFKLKSSDRYFASIKIGDVTKWLKNTLSDYEVSENPIEDGFFNNLNNESSPINILMSSRAIYEGWDSNRPNVMVFVNIGTGDARKYVLQALGRGIRIEPLRDKRQRLETLWKNGDSGAKELHSLVKESNMESSSAFLETLFVYGTNQQNLKEIMESIRFERENAGEFIDLRKNQFQFSPILLLPVYADKKDIRLQELPKFQGNFTLLKGYVEWVGDDRVLYALNSENASPSTIARLHEYLKTENFVNTGQGNPQAQLSSLMDHLNTAMKELNRFKELESEIIHFREISLEVNSPEKKKELVKKIEEVMNYRNPDSIKQELKRKLDSREIGIDEYTTGIEGLAGNKKQSSFEYEDDRIELINIAQHYFMPLILTESGRADFINHIIKVESERNFVQDLDSFLTGVGGKNLNLDWWVFSKLDESIDSVNIPYYDSGKNKMRAYSPDFIFWLKKGNEYRIVFVDPKSTKYTDYEQKADYFSRLFEENGSQKVFRHGDFSIKVHLFMKTDNLGAVGQNYRKYWIDNVAQIFSVL